MLVSRQRIALLGLTAAVFGLFAAAGCSSSAPPEQAAKGPEAREELPVPRPEIPAAANTAPAPSRVEPTVPRLLAPAPARRLPTVADPVSTAVSQPTPAAVKPVPASFTDTAPGNDSPPRRNPLRSRASDSPTDRPGRSSKAVPSDSFSSVAQSQPGHNDAKPEPANEKTQPAQEKPQPAEEKFDPIKENGQFFVGWPKPKLALVITGRQDGYLEPCGCAGLDRMKGGLMRRHSFFEQVRRERGWPVVALDVGGLINGFGRQAELKFQTAVEAMRKMGYDAIGFGKGELRLPTGELVAVAADATGPFISANVGLFGFAAGLTSTRRIVEAGGKKIGVMAVIGAECQKQITSASVETLPAEDAIRKVLPELKKARCDLLILLAYATTKEATELAKKFPDFDVVVTGGGVGDPPKDPLSKLGEKPLVVETGEKGAGAVVLGLYDDEPRIRYQAVLFDSRYPSSPDIRALFAAYQGQLQAMGLAGLGVRVMPYPRRELLGRFVGSKKCQECHEESYKIWKKSKHAHAYATLQDTNPPRNFDPECISCHVIGWHPTEYFPYQGGFLSTKKTPELIDVGCEACHGAGEAHCAAEIKNDPALQEKLQKAMVVTKEESEKRFCATCHDLDNSPAFDFKTYWPKVEHYENEE